MSLVRLFSLLFSVESPIDANSFVEPAHCFACVQCEKRNYWPGIKLWTWQIPDILNCGLGFVKVCSQSPVVSAIADLALVRNRADCLPLNSLRACRTFLNVSGTCPL